MSKSRASKIKGGQNSIIFGEGFPVGVSVCNCYLKKIVVKEKVWRDVPFHRIYLYFLHEPSNRWITKYISDKPLESFNSVEKYRENKLHVAACLENLMACYLSGAHIKHIMFQTEISGIVNKVEEIKQALLKNKFWDTEVCLKTVPNDDGGVSIGKYAPYMNLPSGTSWSLFYSSWESNKLK